MDTSDPFDYPDSGGKGNLSITTAIRITTVIRLRRPSGLRQPPQNRHIDLYGDRMDIILFQNKITASLTLSQYRLLMMISSSSMLSSTGCVVKMSEKPFSVSSSSPTSAERCKKLRTVLFLLTSFHPSDLGVFCSDRKRTNHRGILRCECER